MRVLVACEFSGMVRNAFAARGHKVYSCDLLPSEVSVEENTWHLEMDAISAAYNFGPWDLMIAHPPCTRMTNAGSRWLRVPPLGKTLAQMWRELEAGCAFYKVLRDAPIPLKAIENPVMHYHARNRLGNIKRQVVQPHWFGDPFFKATGFELIGLPELRRTHHMTLPKKGTPEHKAWSAVHRASPGPDRWKDRSRTFPGLANALAEQWGSHD